MRITSAEDNPVKVAAAINDAARRLDTAEVGGDTTGGNANTGNIGEIIEGDVPSGTPTSLTNGVTINLVSIVLTAGDWDVLGIVQFQPGATTTTTAVLGGLTTTSVTIDATNGRFTQMSFPAGSNVQSLISTPIIPCRFSLAATTTIYLIVVAAFAVSTMAVYGHLRARRVR